jgi:hypothetical protein
VGSPGNFCTPVRIADRLIYVAHHEGKVSILSTDVGSDEPPRDLGTIEGLAALVPSPSGRWLARAVAEDPSHPYRDLSLLDPETGAEIPLTDLDAVAFIWLPNERGLVVAHQDGPRVDWYRVGLDGSKLLLYSDTPTRDMAFYLRFFEQYCLSHPLISPDGSTLLVAGYGKGSDKRDDPRVSLVPLNGDKAEELTAGVFAVYPRNA